jgi:hypothetical protein
MIPDHAPATPAVAEFSIEAPTREDFRRYAHRWLLVVPFIWQIALVPFFNSASVRVFSLPLPMVWQMAGILVATGIIAFVFRTDQRIERADRSPASADPETRS